MRYRELRPRGAEAAPAAAPRPGSLDPPAAPCGASTARGCPGTGDTRPFTDQHLAAFIATAEPPSCLRPQLCCLCSSSLSPAPSLGTGEAEANNRYKSCPKKI